MSNMPPIDNALKAETSRWLNTFNNLDYGLSPYEMNQAERLKVPPIFVATNKKTAKDYRMVPEQEPWKDIAKSKHYFYAGAIFTAIIGLMTIVKTDPVNAVAGAAEQGLKYTKTGKFWLAACACSLLGAFIQSTRAKAIEQDDSGKYFHKGPTEFTTYDATYLDRYDEFLKREPAFGSLTSKVTPGKPEFLSEKDFTLLKHIEDQVNEEFRSCSLSEADEKQWKKDDYYAFPKIGQYSDCEDFALEKMKRLIKAGVNPRALSLAVVREHGAEWNHMLLLAHTTKGPVVLNAVMPHPNGTLGKSEIRYLKDYPLTLLGFQNPIVHREWLTQPLPRKQPEQKIFNTASANK
jgi:predicted transglutaminase-like cysteine proteinase